MLEHRSFLQDHLPPLPDSHWVAWYTQGEVEQHEGNTFKLRCVSQGLKMLLNTRKLDVFLCGSEDWSKVYMFLHLLIQLFWLNYTLNYFYFVNPFQHKRVWRVLRLVKYQLSPTVLQFCLLVCLEYPLPMQSPSGLFGLFYTTFHSTE